MSQQRNHTNKQNDKQLNMCAKRARKTKMIVEQQIKAEQENQMSGSAENATVQVEQISKSLKKLQKIQQDNNNPVKSVSRRKLIQKVRNKLRRQQQRVAQSYSGIVQQPRSGLLSLISNNTSDTDYDMLNHVSMGQNRKLKKKMKKLQAKFPGEDGKRKVFGEMVKFKQALYRGHEKKLFNPVDEMQRRRDKRMRRMEMNAKKHKAEVLHKQLEKF